ncbi:hypothetical protein NDU88_007374 [Pleurodeles waltl]|uniref:Uncharacterized protein n=1 Tax=Pleurodeles waltl TaxID=8319 RepID=A0AAV7UPP9_PLEWA|nr:hypothetical protein NDU88_007374 [Pleurodeles waltl]
MGRRGGSSAGPLEQRVTVSPVSPGMRSHRMALAPTIHVDKLDKILEAIEATGQDLRKEVNAVEMEISLLCKDQKKLSARVTSRESDLRDLLPSLADMKETGPSLISNAGEAFVASSPNAHPDQFKRKKRSKKTPPATSTDTMIGVPTPGQARLEQLQLRYGRMRDRPRRSSVIDDKLTPYMKPLPVKPSLTSYQW